MPSAPPLDFRHSPLSFRQRSRAAFALIRGTGVHWGCCLLRRTLWRCWWMGWVPAFAGTTKFTANTPCNVRIRPPSPHPLPASRSEGVMLGTVRQRHAAFGFFAALGVFRVAAFLRGVRQAAPRRVSQTSPQSRQTGDETIARQHVPTSSRRPPGVLAPWCSMGLAAAPMVPHWHEIASSLRASQWGLGRLAMKMWGNTPCNVRDVRHAGATRTRHRCSSVFIRGSIFLAGAYGWRGDPPHRMVRAPAPSPGVAPLTVLSRAAGEVYGGGGGHSAQDRNNPTSPGLPSGYSRMRATR
jgi:hypothetical protein